MVTGDDFLPKMLLKSKLVGNEDSLMSSNKPIVKEAPKSVFIVEHTFKENTEPVGFKNGVNKILVNISPMKNPNYSLSRSTRTHQKRAAKNTMLLACNWNPLACVRK